MSEQSVKRSATIHLDGTPEVVFPLFTPVGEYKWIRGWNPELIYPPSGEAMTNNIFITQHPGEGRSIFVTVDYNTDSRHAEYIRVTPDSHVTRIDINCQPAENGGTDAQISYTVTAIAEAGYSEADNLTEAAYAQRMETWQHAINYYLETGELIPQHSH